MREFMSAANAIRADLSSSVMLFFNVSCVCNL